MATDNTWEIRIKVHRFSPALVTGSRLTSGGIDYNRVLVSSKPSPAKCAFAQTLAAAGMFTYRT